MCVFKHLHLYSVLMWFYYLVCEHVPPRAEVPGAILKPCNNALSLSFRCVKTVPAARHGAHQYPGAKNHRSCFDLCTLSLLRSTSTLIITPNTGLPEAFTRLINHSFPREFAFSLLTCCLSHCLSQLHMLTLDHQRVYLLPAQVACLGQGDHGGVVSQQLVLAVGITLVLFRQ